MVVGPWGNGSRDLHDLVRTLAEARVEAKARSRGRPASDHELGTVIGDIRRSLSLAFVSALVSLSWGRVPGQQLVDGSRHCWRRRGGEGTGWPTTRPTSGEEGSTGRGRSSTATKFYLSIHFYMKPTYAVYPKSMVNRRCRRKANGKGGRGYQREQRKRRGRCSYT